MDYGQALQDEIVTTPPAPDTVVLPGGYMQNGVELVRSATVRELTGADEEIIARTSNRGLLLNTILSRGVVALGAEKVKPSDLDNMLAGDRDALLLEIRKVTYGSTVEVTNVCEKCSTSSQYLIDLNEDVPTVKLSNPDKNSVFTVALKQGTATVALPTGKTQKRLMENYTKTAPELVTILLSSCLLSVNDEPSVGEFTAASLSVLDREKIVGEILERNPGPRLGEVSKACKACGEDVAFPLSLAGLFRL